MLGLSTHTVFHIREGEARSLVDGSAAGVTPQPPGICAGQGRESVEGSGTAGADFEEEGPVVRRLRDTPLSLCFGDTRL